MRSRKLPALTALVVTIGLSLALSSCGSDSGPSDKIKGADDGKVSSSPSASKNPEAEAGSRPEIKLPSDLTYRFAWGDTGDEKKDAVLSDTEQFIKSVDMAIVKQKPLDKAYIFYSEGDAAAGSQEWIQGFVDDGNRITGFRRFYNARVHVKDDKSASVVYCEDQSKAYNKDIKNGKVDKTPATKDSYVLYSSLLQLNDQGTWVTMKLMSNRGSSQCQP